METSATSKAIWLTTVENWKEVATKWNSKACSWITQAIINNPYTRKAQVFFN